MMQNVLIIGSNSIFTLNEKQTLLDSHYEVIVSPHHGQHSHIPSIAHTSTIEHLTAYSAPLVYAIAQTHLPHISNVIINIRIPTILPFHTLADSTLEGSFHTEWYFNIELIRQAILYFDKQSHSAQAHQLPDRKIFICIPDEKVKSLNDSQRIYFISMKNVLRQILKNVDTKNSISIINYPRLTEQQNTNPYSLLDFIVKIHKKNIHRKTFSLYPIHKRILQKIKK